MTLYGRRVRVTVAGLVATQSLRIGFTVERQADATQTTGRVSIYNLSPSRANQIYSRSEAITIEAGYPDTIATIFDGQVQRVRQPRQGLAHITLIELGDKVNASGRLGGVTSRSYAGPVSVRAVVRDMVLDMDAADPLSRISIGPLRAIPESATVTDFAYSGSAREGLTTLLRKFSLTWFEDDGVIRFNYPSRRGGNAPVQADDNERALQPDAPTIDISPLNGLVGAPLPTDEGAELKMFLNPQARVGGRLNLTSEALSGSFRIVGLRHDGDSWQGPFSTWTDLRNL